MIDQASENNSASVKADGGAATGAVQRWPYAGFKSSLTSDGIWTRTYENSKPMNHYSKILEISRVLYFRRWDGMG